MVDQPCRQAASTEAGSHLSTQQQVRYIVKSLGQYAAFLAVHQISPDEILSLRMPVRDVLPFVCPNQACTKHGHVGQANVHLFATYLGKSWGSYYYCNECGSCFSEDGRLIMTFDEEHGSTHVDAKVLAHHQGQLESWKVDLNNYVSADDA